MPTAQLHTLLVMSVLELYPSVARAVGAHRTVRTYIHIILEPVYGCGNMSAMYDEAARLLCHFGFHAIFCFSGVMT